MPNEPISAAPQPASVPARSLRSAQAPSTSATCVGAPSEVVVSSRPWLPGASPGVAKESSASAASRTTGTCSSTALRARPLCPVCSPCPLPPRGAAMTRSRTPSSGSQEAMMRKEPGTGAASPLSGNQRR